jgi:hypothetical protein
MEALAKASDMEQASEQQETAEHSSECTTDSRVSPPRRKQFDLRIDDTDAVDNRVEQVATPQRKLRMSRNSPQTA